MQTVKNNIFTSLAKLPAKLQACTDIIIRPADKGGGIVVMDIADYMMVANRQLSGSNFYRFVDNDHKHIFPNILTRTPSNYLTTKRFPQNVINIWNANGQNQAPSADYQHA